MIAAIGRANTAFIRLLNSSRNSAFGKRSQTRPASPCCGCELPALASPPLPGHLLIAAAVVARPAALRVAWLVRVEAGLDDGCGSDWHGAIAAVDHRLVAARDRVEAERGARFVDRVDAAAHVGVE